ncbi:MAG: glycosyltransferase family 39 protein [Cytophagales bacterium]|nr:glycosyltransferase family 39 protein [Cytophagales bacterium]
MELLNNDEAISAVAGVEIAHGGLAYKDAVDHRGPVTYYLYALAFRLGGDYNMWYVRILLSLLRAASAWILFKAVELMDPKAAALVTAIFCLMTVYGSSGDFLAFHTEWPMCFFVVLAGYGMIKIMKGSSISPLAPLGVGFSFAMAILSKQLAVFDIAAWGTLFIIYAFYQEKFRVFWINVSWMAFSFVVTLGLVVGYFYLNGGLEDFIFYVFTYNSAYYMKGKSLLSLPWDMVNQLSWFFWSRKYLLLLLLFTFLSIAFIKRGNSQVSVAKFLAASALCFFIALIGTCLSGRPFGHYVIQLIPYISFFLGYAVFAISLRMKGNTMVPVGLILASIGFYLQFYILHTRSIKAGNAFKNDPIFSYINDHKQPQDNYLSGALTQNRMFIPA